MKLKNILITAISLLSIGCVGFVHVPVDDDHGHGTDVNDHYYDYYVDTYVSVPKSIQQLIAPYVHGYFSPELNRYDEYLYPSYVPYDPYDLPCYVRADYNGDGLYDYAFLFSTEEWDSYYWYVTTRLIMVLSTPYGYEISADINLGTIYAEEYIPVEEYWAISYMPPGYHSISNWYNGTEYIETVYLDDPAIFLASHDPDDEAIFYAIEDDVYEIEWVGDHIIKRSANERKATRGKIKFEKSSTERKSMVERKAKK